jgi:hypothetical protein
MVVARKMSALRRGDLVSVNHRVAALLASYFDVVLAANRMLHPDEKRLVEWTLAHCAHTPENMAAQVQAVLHTAGSLDGGVVAAVNTLLDGLDAFLDRETPHPRVGEFRIDRGFFRYIINTKYDH